MHLAVILISASACASESSPVTALQLDERIVAYRQSILSGIVDLTVANGKTTTIHRVTFDHGGFRGDNTLTDMETNETYHESHVFLADSDTVLSFSDRHRREGATLVGSIRRDSVRERLRVPSDPRLIGIHPVWFTALVHTSLNTVFTNPEWTRTDPIPATIGEHECLFVSYSKSDALIEAWIDPNRNANPIRMVGKSMNGEREQSIECSLSVVEGLGWFPSAVTFTQKRQGEVTDVEYLSVRVTQFNKPVDKTAFTFSGMGMPEGYPIRDYTDAARIRKLVLKNGEAVEVAGGRDSEGVSHIDGSRRRSLQMWVSINLGIALLVFALWSLFRK